jgi:hypothetical protein
MSRSTVAFNLLLVTGFASSLLAQSAPSKAPLPEPGATQKGAAAATTPSPNLNNPAYQREFAAIQDRVGKASGQVMSRIVQAENELYIRFSYFKKPERLDPNSFATKDEVASWVKSLDELKAHEVALDRLYSNADSDLQNALVAQQIPSVYADQIKKQLLKSFPWDTIHKKQLLMQDYIADHGELLALYDKNWGAWKKGNQPLKPVFDNPGVGASYAKLRDKILSTGKQLEEQFTALRQ